MEKLTSPTGIETYWKKIDPVTARKILDEKNHPNQRPINQRRVERLRKDLKEGLFLESHQGLCFDLEGCLIDGQHRLEAIASSGISCFILVSEKADPRLFRRIDQGQSRTLRDLLAFSGLEVSKHISSAIALISSIASGYSSTTGTYFHFEHSEAVLRKYEDSIREIAEATKGAEVVMKIRHGGCIAAAFFAHLVDRKKTLDWLHKAKTGENLKAGDPELAYRKFMVTNHKGLTRGNVFKACAISLFKKVNGIPCEKILLSSQSSLADELVLQSGFYKASV